MLAAVVDSGLQGNAYGDGLKMSGMPAYIGVVCGSFS